MKVVGISHSGLPSEAPFREVKGQDKTYNVVEENYEVVVGPEYRRNGIATTMLKVSWKIAKEFSAKVPNAVAELSRVSELGAELAKALGCRAIEKGERREPKRGDGFDGGGGNTSLVKLLEDEDF